MSLPVKSQQDLYTLFITALQSYSPDITDTNDGSMVDTLAGVFSLGGTELTRLITDQFNKTFFSLANGPEVTGGPDDLQTLAVDHFGDDFARPQAVTAIDTVTFARPNNSGGTVLIPAGTIVKTAADANGKAQRYATNADVTMTATGAGTDTSVTVNVTAVVAGAAGNAAVGTINVIESSLLDTTITVTNTGNATGSDAQDDATYRTTIQNLIEALAGATANAVAAKALTVSGVVTATAIEQALTVIQYIVSSGGTLGSYFRIPVPYLYIADATGTASQALISAVTAAINSVRALGVYINVAAATAFSLAWDASFTLNPVGPNYATFVNNPQKILDSMTDYLNALPVGTSFVRATANTAILAIWGPSGTNDLTAFTTNTPSGDVAVTATQKIIAGTVSKT
jgi:hypothetical protein